MKWWGIGVEESMDMGWGCGAVWIIDTINDLVFFVGPFPRSLDSESVGLARSGVRRAAADDGGSGGDSPNSM